jgi:hypothetical protein
VLALFCQEKNVDISIVGEFLPGRARCFFDSVDMILVIWASDRRYAELDLTNTVIYAIFRASSVLAF